jgi:hypothetical protein
MYEVLLSSGCCHGSGVLSPVPPLFRGRVGPVPILFAARLMTRSEGDIGRQQGSSASGEKCPCCSCFLPDEWIKAAHSRVAGRSGGRPRVQRKCACCNKEFGSRELRRHLPGCRKEHNTTISSG